MRKTLLHKMFAVAIFLVANITMASAQTQQAQYRYDWKGTTPSAAAAATDPDLKTVFLVNVGKYEHATSKNSPFFIGRGQEWGTEIVISNIPIPLNVTNGSTSGTYRLMTTITEQSSTTNGFIGFINDNNNQLTYFNDRGTTDNINTTFKATPAVTTAATKLTSANIFTMTHDATINGTTRTYYAAAMHNTNSSDNVDRTDHVNGFTKALLDAEKANKEVSDDDDKWMLITLQELKDYFKEVDAAQSDPAISTFLLNDPDFGRSDQSISYWKDNSGNALTNDQGRASAGGDNKETSPSENWKYYVGNGFNRDYGGGKDGNGQLNNGGQWTANIKGQGKVSQTFSMTGMREGWYAVRVSATTFGQSSKGQDANVKLFAEISNTTGNNSYQPASANNKINAETDSPTRFINAEKIVNDGYHQASVLIYVSGGQGSDLLIPESANQKLTIGIDATDAPTGTWTCFDNFQLWYLGKPQNKVLLDEETTSINYINAQNTYVNTENLTDNKRSKSTVFMNRNMTPNTWNTLVLPFSIEEDVVTSVFGAGTVYAVLEGATDNNNPTTIYFNRETDGMEAGKLYLIRPTNSQPINQPAVSSSTLKENSTEPLITWGEEGINNQSYWRFEAVDFGKDKVDNKIVDYDQLVYSGNLGPETAESGTVYFAGTYISHGNEYYIPKYSYVLQGSTTNTNTTTGSWYYRTASTRTKGFRGWLQTTDPSKQNETPTQPSKDANAIFNVDGVIWPTNGTVTSIDNINIDGMNVVIRDNNVYNLQGQRVRRGSSLEGLAKGIYVVNGKKILVR